MKGEQTRQRIIEQAAPLFNERGFAGASMSDIMEATGLEKGGIYRYFGSKEALASEALQFAVAETRRVRTHDLEHLPTAMAKLRAGIDSFVDVPSPVRGGCPLMNAAIDSDNGNEELRRVARGAFVDWRKRLAALVKEGIDAGEFRSETSPEQVADWIIAALEGALVLRRIRASAEALLNVREMLFTMLEGLQVSHSRLR